MAKPKKHRVKDTLHSLDVRPSKQRGQNFIKDEFVIDEILQFGAPRPDERLVEIGPGLGALTKHLVKVAPLTVIEIEERFIPALRGLSPHITVVESDFRGVDLAEIGESLTVFGNIPYVFSTDIIFHLIHHARSVKRAVLMLQREFAERLAAPPGNRTYGALTVTCGLWASVRLGPIISGEVFHPPTEVESQVIELTFSPEPRYPVTDPFFFRRVVQAGFQQRRKKLANSLVASGMFPSLKVEAALAAAGIDGNRRAETLSVEEFARLANELLE